MTSRLRTAVAALFVVLSFSYGAVVTPAGPVAAQRDCVRPCRF
ncbi:hypothetical protein H4696_005050 [Amycolatopsis lexingtonensis]|uniref:Uncharacterized protein n=1 Tax=Amycolatopsis lexingtonensis TaxID=218822 RepID=A0ABR9I447_9PSEU|nr:hypothetical protein [Amycolatopsis lexingtonensis]MBE1497950.1 hypothetical protein [Amycolatopsis lexingtonensis]